MGCIPQVTEKLTSTLLNTEGVLREEVRVLKQPKRFSTVHSCPFSCTADKVFSRYRRISCFGDLVFPTQKCHYFLSEHSSKVLQELEN